MERFIVPCAGLLMIFYLLESSVLHNLSDNVLTGLKALPVVMLAGAVFVSRRAPNPLFLKYCTFTSSGLLLCATGDVLLDFGKSYFIPGLTAFLLGHILYIFAFTVGGTWRKSFTWKALPFFAYTLAMFCYLVSSLPVAFIAPVFLYCIAIASMATKSVGRCCDQFSGRGLVLGGVGALFFMVSDSVLSFTMFRFKFAGSGLVVMCTYYGAQLFIGLSACAFLSGGAACPIEESSHGLLPALGDSTMLTLEEPSPYFLVHTGKGEATSSPQSFTP